MCLHFIVSPISLWMSISSVVPSVDQGSVITITLGFQQAVWQ